MTRDATTKAGRRAMLLDAIEKEKRDLLAHLEAYPYGDRGQFLVELADTDRLIRALLATTAAGDHISPTKRGYWRVGDPPILDPDQSGI